MMEKPWLKSYPPGVPANIDLGAYHSIVDLLEQSCAKYKDRMAYHNMGAELSYAELDYRPDDAKYPAISGCAVRRFEGRSDHRQHQPHVHGT